MPAPYVGGVAVGAGQPWNTRRALDYQEVSANGATWLRSDFAWIYVEPVQNDYRWALFDPVIANVNQFGLKYLAILHTVPDWANGGAGDYGPVTNIATIKNYSYLTAKRYLPLGVTHYQIGNEINLPHPGWGTPNGATYVTKFLAPQAEGVRQAATELGIPATIMFGSMAPTEFTGGTEPNTFLTAAYGAGAAGKFDLMAWHPYVGSLTPTNSPHMNADVVGIWNIMNSNGDGAKKIWATEYGQPTGGNFSITEAQQVTDMVEAVNLWYGKSMTGPLLYYQHRDQGTSATEREEHFGMMRVDGTKKPSWTTYGSLFSKSAAPGGGSNPWTSLSSSG